jgi:hypothetical protein
MSGWDPNYFLKDEETLKELGYRQQLIRNLGPLENFGISFSIIVSGTRSNSKSVEHSIY